MKASIEREKIITLGKRTKKGQLFFNSLFSKPVVTIKDVQASTGLSTKAANDLVKAFIGLKILREITGYQRNRIFIFDEYVRMF